jgi:flavin-binding protein dodecin
MSIAKVIEVIAESEESWEDAARSAVEHASVTVKDIKHLYVKDLQAIVEDEKIVKFRLNCNLTFLVKHHVEHIEGQ